MKIEILGSGCPRCQATEKNIKQALTEMGLEAEIVKVTDPREYPKYGVMLTPAVVIDGKLKASGHIPKVSEIKSWL